MNPRKVVLVRETVYRDGDRMAPVPVTRIAVVVVLPNPAAGCDAAHEHDALDALIALGPLVVQTYLQEALALLPGKPVAYGKAAMVGGAGQLEHGAAILHPKLGAPLRVALGGGAAIIPSTCKVAAMGSSIDVPLGNKDDVWSFDELDTMTVRLDDAPKDSEIVVIIAVSDGGRPVPRISKSRLA